MEPIKAPWKNSLVCCLQGYRQPNQASKEGYLLGDAETS